MAPSSSFLYVYFFQTFEAEVEVTNLSSGRRYLVRESVSAAANSAAGGGGGGAGDSVELRMSPLEEVGGRWDERICSYSRASGFGHKVRGVHCIPTVNLPTNCFCPSSASAQRSSPSSSAGGGGGGGGAYIPLVDLLSAVTAYGLNFTSFQVDYRYDRSYYEMTIKFPSSFRLFKRWRVDEKDLSVEAIFAEFPTLRPPLEDGGEEEDLRPFSLKIRHNGENI